jgi:hypothetical protein
MLPVPLRPRLLTYVLPLLIVAAFAVYLWLR